jgi:hypothetical protein
MPQLYRRRVSRQFSKSKAWCVSATHQLAGGYSAFAYSHRLHGTDIALARLAFVFLGVNL